jgi:hypothetical protein
MINTSSLSRYGTIKTCIVLEADELIITRETWCEPTRTVIARDPDTGRRVFEIYSSIGDLLFSSSPASGRPALHESLFYISVPRWIFLLTFFPVLCCLNNEACPTVWA